MTQARGVPRTRRPCGTYCTARSLATQALGNQQAAHFSEAGEHLVPHWFLCPWTEMFEKHEDKTPRYQVRNRRGEQIQTTTYWVLFWLSTLLLTAAACWQQRRSSQAEKTLLLWLFLSPTFPWALPIPPTVLWIFPPSPGAVFHPNAEAGPGSTPGWPEGRGSPHGGSSCRAGRGVRAPTALAAPHQRSLCPQSLGLAPFHAPLSSPSSLLPQRHSPVAPQPGLLSPLLCGGAQKMAPAPQPSSPSVPAKPRGWGGRHLRGAETKYEGGNLPVSQGSD